MHEFFNLDKAPYLIWNIVDAIRCASCDKLQGTRVRYPCGHTSCEDCANVANECLDCPMNQLNPATINYKHDPVLTKLAENVFNLKNTFEQAFKTDVYARRTSEQLKIERKVFPRCIQAEHKYINKRKSTSTPRTSLSPRFPGENMIKKMADPISYVKSWLEQSNASHDDTIFNIDNNPRTYRRKTKQRAIGRLPLSDLETNTLERKVKISDNFNASVKSRKRSYDKKDLTFKKQENMSATPKKVKLESNKENIVTSESSMMDIIVINDTEPQIDKDEEALAAILEADKTLNLSDRVICIDEESSAIEETVGAQPNTPTSKRKVPFLYKGNLSPKKVNKVDNQLSDIVLKTITVEPVEYTTNVKVTECDNVSKPSSKFKYSQIIQTQAVIEPEPRRKCREIEDVSLGDIQNVLPNTDSDLTANDINPENVLRERSDLNVIPKRRTQRQIASSDSSEKENKDPNRRRKIKGKGKKKQNDKGNMRQKYYNYKL